MPTYEYECKDCNIKKDVIKPFAEFDTKEFCDKCDKEVDKLYGTFGINLKGPGFYSTDNRK